MTRIYDSSNHGGAFLEAARDGRMQESSLSLRNGASGSFIAVAAK
jgi:hypothetical protein